MAALLQARLLLWKDYLIRKRKPITLSGVAWATLVMLSLYTVRVNVDNTEYPTCQFAARALPSAGVLNFLQSFICNVNNECTELDKFEEIPSYEKSSFSKLQRELSAVLDEPRVLHAAGAMSHAARILSSLANIADNPLLLDITRNGFHVSDLFRNPKRIRRFLTKRLEITEEVANSVIMAEIGLNSIIKGDVNRCNIDSVGNILKINNSEHLKAFVEKLCSLSKKDVQNLVMDLILEADLGKYIKMLGEMYFKLSGDTSVVTLGDMTSAAFRMMAPGSFLPRELSSQETFSYINMTMITKVMDVFEPTFGETDSFKSLKDFVDTAVLGSQYLQKLLASDDTDSADSAISSVSNMGFGKIKKIYNNLIEAMTENNSTDVTDSFFNIASRITNFLFKWLPDDQKQDILFYFTLLSKLVEGAQKVIHINTNIESLVYNASLRNPKGVELLLSTPPNVIGNGLEALTDAKRTQILTSKVSEPGQIFCDIEGIKNIFLISEAEAGKLKSQLCTDVWKNFINDLVSSFGIYDVKENINSMASLFVLQTIGRDISDQLYTIDKDFDILKNFVKTVKSLEGKEIVHVDWAKAWNISEQSELLKVFRSKDHLGKRMLITVHGALAKEVVRQNPLLEYKISPFLKDVVIMVDAMNEQLNEAPKDLQKIAKKMYPDIIQTMLATAIDEDKTYKMMSTPCADMLCNGPDNASVYLNFPDNINKKQLVSIMCNITLAIEEGLKNDSIIGKAIDKMKTIKHSVLEEVNWTQLITGLNKLYATLYDDYTYLFNKTYGMDETLKKKVLKEIEEVKEFWFNIKSLNRVMHLSIKLGFRLLDLLDHGVFNISQPVWREIKLRLYSAVGPIAVVDDILQTIQGVPLGPGFPPGADSLSALVSGMPRLLTDSVDLIIRDNTDIQSVITILNGAIPWPCSSITPVLELSPSSVAAVKGMERFMCLDDTLQEQWRKYLEERRVFPEIWNTTELPKNIFLKFSAAFDTVIKDFDIANTLLNEAFDESKDEATNLAFSITYIINAFNKTDKNEIIRTLFTKVDAVLNSINTSSIRDTVSLNILWKEYLNCSQGLKGRVIDESCKTLGRATWKHTLKFISVAFENVTEDLTTYLKESREQNATVIQKLGFTRHTGLFMLYDQLPDYIAVLINSYFDYGFMSKVRRASRTQFWDCEEVVSALVGSTPFAPPAPEPRRILALVCPSLLYWLSMPRGDNSLIDLFTKPQHLFFSLEVANLTSTYEKAYTNFNELTTILNDTSYNNSKTLNDMKLSTLRKELERAVDTVLSYRIKETDESYLKFSENSKKQYLLMIYLTRVVTMINKLTTALDNFNMTNVTEAKTLEAELTIIQKSFKRRPSEVIALHFDLITDVLWNNDENYKMVEALNNACDRLKNKDTSKDILVELDRVKAQICVKQYKVLYGALQNVVDDDFDAARNSLLNLVKVTEEGAVSDISAFFEKRKGLVDSLKTSVKYAYDLSTPIYLKYLQSNLKHYDIILTFLSGGNWWDELRKLYNGPQATEFFDTVEQIFDVSEDILTHLDKIHLVKMLRDVNVNNTEALCRLTLSDYLPDSTGVLSTLHARACNINRTLLFKEIPPLLFASQGYDGSLTISSEVDYSILYSDISNTESMVERIKDGPKSPSRPPWVTDNRLNKFRAVAVNLLSKESLIKISFGLLGNVVDAGTLFLNNSQCTLCSTLTTWIKQLDLQLYKRQEYDSLLCSLDTMKLEDIHTSLRSNFHWDMAITELISTRNYTKYELNKSINELLEQIKLQLLEDVSANTTKLYQCLANNVTRNEFGNAALFAKVLSRTAKLVRAMLPHLQEIPGIIDLLYFKQLYTDVAHKLHANDTLAKYINNNFSQNIMEEIKNKKLVKEIEIADVDLFMIKNGKASIDSVYLKGVPWNEICDKHDCDKIMKIINTHTNKTLVNENLLILQKTEFWKFPFISNIVNHLEDIVEHLAGVVGRVSEIDIAGVKEGRLVPVLDTALKLMRDDFMDDLVYSVLGMVKELDPLLHGTALEFDITAVTDGLKILQRFKNFLVQQDYKINIQPMFPHSDRIESSLGLLGINNTNFWSVAAPRIQTGQISIKTILSHKGSIADFVCQLDPMAPVLLLGAGAVQRDDVLAAVLEQFCGAEDQLAKDILLVLMENLDFGEIMSLVKTELLSKLFTASNLTQSEGDAVLSQFGEIATYLPVMRERMANLGDALANEPLIARLKSGSFGDILSSPDFFSEAGRMVCGAPLQVKLARLYRTVASTPDLKAEPDQKQLDALPTEFCRSLYKDIVSMEGGKILWSFVKPLVMGRILYTPPSAAVNKIIEKANATFAPMMELMNIVHEFSASFPFIINMTHHRDGLRALQNIVTMPQFQGLRETIIGNVSAPDVNVDQMLDQLGDVEWLGGLLSRASGALRCVSLQRFAPAPAEHDLALEAARLTMINEFSAGLVFMNMTESDQFPSNIAYKIRMDIENAPTTKRIIDYFWVPGPKASFLENMRYFRGFVQIQDIIDKAIIELSMENSAKVQKREIKEKSDWSIYTQQLPYPCYIKDFFQTSLYESQALIVAFFFSLLFSVCSAVRFIVRDKETGNTMLMSVMGVNLGCHTLSWFVASLLELAVTMCCVCAVLCGGRVLPRSDPSLVLTLLMLYALSVLTFCYMMSKMFYGAGSAAVVSGLTYLLSFMPFVLILSLEAVMTSSLKIFVSLSMSSSLCYAFLFITRLEATGTGAGWSQLWDTPEGSTDMSIGIAGLMVIADGVMYLIVGLVLDKFYGIKTTSNITILQGSNEKAGVSIVNVSKVYNEGTRRAKLALDGVSMELHQGQITTLLGHNGAGKTTLIKILTGMLKSSKGHVVIRSDRGAGRALLGVCPQHDVLLDQLTAREHVLLYAQLKSGRAHGELKEDVDSMLSVLSLGSVQERPVGKLSGGTRRRLCVALAFVGGPALVSLDEPTAGVDPAARRDIWSMIMKLRENRTILMTTHHLDEAELLSDQIIILHKGQIHTTGSPIEIKRTLGTGYKLTITFPEEEAEKDGIEEKTKELLAIVRGVVKNANLVDVNGPEIEINLPFYDASGISNDVQGACRSLETASGSHRVTLDCSTLEQVFHDLCRDPEECPISSIPDASSLPESSKSVSGSGKSDLTPLVEPEGPLKGSLFQQFCALMYARYLHYIRNKWLVLILVVLPSLFLAAAMAFSSIRPPADIEISLKLDTKLYEPSTQFMIKQPSVYSDNIDPSFAKHVLDILQSGRRSRNWTSEDSPTCKCMDSLQYCDIPAHRGWDLPETMLLPDVSTLNNWLVDSQKVYIEKRYGGFTSTVRNNRTYLVAWYNNAGHHALPVYINALNTALLRSVTGDPRANITVYTHPLKISTEQLNKDTVYQHIADAGISSMLLIAYSLAGAGGAALVVGARVGRQKRLQLLCGVPPALLIALQLLWDMAVIVINMIITAIILEIFQFPVFVERNNLPAICILILLYGYACSGLVGVFEKLFSEPSLATMLLFCGNAFAGLVGIALMLILDVISDSDATDNARYILHKILLLSPQFALGDGLLEVAKNTIQAQVLRQFNMDTYRDPIFSNVVWLHYGYLLAVGTSFIAINLLIEYHCFESILDIMRGSEDEPEECESQKAGGLMPEAGVAEEAARVLRALAPLTLRTVGNINAGFVDTEDLAKPRTPPRDADACATLRVRQQYGRHVALRGLTLGLPPGQCTVLLGENGAGKSTTFSILTGELKPTSGDLYLQGRRVSPRDLCQGLISYCPQSDAVDQLLTVKETLYIYCQLRGIKNPKEVVFRTLEAFELRRYASVRAGALSGGTRRKLCAALATAARAPLLLLDEPTSGMDPLSRACVWRSVRAACAGARVARPARAALLSTHALDDARRLARRVALLRDGQLCAVAPLQDCLRRFGGGYVVSCRARASRAAWRRVRTLAPRAVLRVLLPTALHFLLPLRATVDGKESEMQLSEIFQLMSELQKSCDIDDYTVNQSSLDQMFLSFTDKTSIVDEDEPRTIRRRHSDELDSVTSL